MTMRRRNRRPQKSRDASRDTRLNGGCTPGESLERRQMFSVAPLMTADEKSAVAAIIGHASTAGEEATAARSLVVVDAGAVQAGAGGVAGIAASFADAAATLVIDSDDDLFADVQAELGRLGGISTIHLVSHGTPGSFTIGSTRFAADTIGGFAASLEGWHRFAAPGADLAIWGCGVAGGDGASLLDSLHGLSGFDVAASTDLTGPSRLGGDFDLEYAAGDVALPGLVSGVDVLWDTTLAAPADHTFTNASKQAVQDAFDTLEETIALKIQEAVAGQTGSLTVDPVAQRAISDLFTASSSISPADLQSFLSLKTTVSTYLGGVNPTLSGLKAAISSALAANASAAGASSPEITVDSTASAAAISLTVSIKATGSAVADVAQEKLDGSQTPWGKAIQKMNSDYGATFRTTPQVRSGSRLATGFTVSVDLTDANNPVPSIEIGSTKLEAGVFEFGPSLRFGILDATIGGESLPYSTSVSFAGGASRTVADWSTVGASASPISSTPSSTINLPITAKIDGVDVAPGAAFSIAFTDPITDPLGLQPPVVTAANLGLIPWFGNISADDIISGIKEVGGVYETLTSTDTLAASIPFLERTALSDVFNFSGLFDEAIGGVVGTFAVNPAEPGLAFTVSAGGTQLTLTGDQRSKLQVGDYVALTATAPTALATVIRKVTAVAVSGGNTRVTISRAIDAATTAGNLGRRTDVRPDSLQTLDDFRNTAYAGLTITPVFDSAAGTLSIELAASRTAPLAIEPAVAFPMTQLGPLTFKGGTSPALSPTVSLGFGVRFDVGPGSAISLALGAQPPSNGKLAEDAALTFTSGADTWEVTVTKAAAGDNSSFADLVADFNAALGTARKVVGGVVSRTTTDISGSFEVTGTGGRVSVATKGPTPTTVLDGQLVATLTAGQLSEDAEFTVTPVGGLPTKITVAKDVNNASLTDLINDVNDALRAAYGDTPLLLARESEFGVGIELYTPTIDASMPLGITIAATRTQGALDLGFTDGIELSDDTKDTPISIFGRPSGVTSRVVPHADTTKKFADASFNWSLAGRSGEVVYGINTLSFGGTTGSVQAAFSAVLDVDGDTAAVIALDPVGKLSPQLTDSATLSLSSLSPVGRTNDIASGASISIAVSDFLAERIDSFVAFGGPLSVPGLEGSGQSTGKLSADTTIRFTISGATYDVTVTQATAAANTTFQELVSEFNAALSSARLVVNGTATDSTVNLVANNVSFVGSGGRVSVMHALGGVTYSVLENVLVANLAAGGTTTGRLATDSSLTVVRGADTYTVTVPASDTTANTTFAQLVADFNAALATAQKRTGSTTTTVDATDVLRFSVAAIAGRIQPEANQSVANPGYAIVTLPPTADLGQAGFQAGLSVPTIASALTQASRVFDTIERDLKEFNSQEIPLLNQALGDLIELDAGLDGRIAAFGKLSASTPQQLERALETSLGVPSSDLRITYDSTLKAYRIDVAYRASKATTVAFDVDLYKYYEELGRVLPKGIDALTDGESKTPLNVVINATSVLSVGYDLTTNKTFLYGHDGSANLGLANGTSFSISFSVNGQKLEFPAKFGLDVRNGVAQLQNGSLVVKLSGPEGTPASSLFYVAPTGSQRAALAIDNYTAEFGGSVTVRMPIYENFAPGTLTKESVAEAQENGVFGFIQNHPASFYLAMPKLADYLDARGRMEEAQTAITSLLSKGQSVDADGVSLATWRTRLDVAASDLGGVLFAFAPELENARNLLGAEETLLDFIRDPAMILDKLNAAVGGVESALKGLDKIAMPFGGGNSIGLGGAVDSVFSWRTGWLLDMRNRMRGAGEGIFDVMRQGVFEYLGPKRANILLKYDPVSMDRSLDSMTPATRPEDIGVVFMDKQRNVLSKDVRGADSFEIVFRLGQKLFDTGIDLGFQLDALRSIGIGAAFDGGLRLQVGWEMLLGFGFSITDGFYLKVDSTGDAGTTGKNFGGSSGQFEAQLRFDATLTGASKDYTQRWDAGGYWKIVDTKGTTITTDDQDVIDATTRQPYRAIAVNKFAADVTAFVDDPDTAEADPCGCGDPPSATRLKEPIWWVVGTRRDVNDPNSDYVPAELNDQGRYVPQASPYAHTLIEVSAMRPAQLSGSLFFLRLAATDKIRRGLSGFTDVDSQYYYDGSEGPQTTALQRDDAETGVNRNNELPTRFTAAVGLNMVDPSASAGKNSVREDASAPAPGMRRVIDAKGQDVSGTSGAIAKPGLAGSLPLLWQAREIQGVYAKEYYDLRLKVAPPAKYEELDMPVRVATGANIALSGIGIIDGVQLKVGDRVLVKSQAIAAQNGIYTVSPGAWSRSFDANENRDFVGDVGSVGKPMFVLVTEGRTNKDTGWNLTDSTFANADFNLGTTPLIFERTMVSVREALPVVGVDVGRLKPYVPYITLPILAKWVDQPLTQDIDINIEYDFANYLVKLRKEDGTSTGPAFRAAQLNQALTSAIMSETGLPNFLTGAGQSYNLAQAGFRFQLAASAKPKWYRVEFARLKESNGIVTRKVDRTGTFVYYGTPAGLDGIGGDAGWDPIADINADASPGRITWPELRSAGAKKIFAVDFHADAVANLTMELSIGDTATTQNLAIPRIYADFNLDWSTRAARAKLDKAKQTASDLKTNPSSVTSGSGSSDEPDISLVKRVEEEEGIEKPASQTTGGDKGIDPASPLVKEMDLRPEIGFSNIRLDVGSFLTDFLKPVVDKAEPYLAQVRPILTFLNSRVPVLSDVAGRNIKVVDLLEQFGGPKAKGVRGVIDTITAIDNLVAQIAALPAGVNIQLPMGRFWLPKVPDADKGGYKYGTLVYDNVALGINTNDYKDADRDAEAALVALASLNPDSPGQKDRQSKFSNSAQDRGGLRVPIIQDPLTLFNLMMGKTATLVTYQLPKLNYDFEKSFPLLRIVCFEVGLRASFELNSNLAFGFDTYGINQYMVSGDALDIAQGFYVSDRANADGTGADVPEFQAIVSLGLYGGIDLVAAKAGIEGGVRVIGEVNLNDPNNDGKLRLTEAIGLVIDTENPLDLFDLSLRGEAYAKYYYQVGLGKLSIKGGKTFARIELFNLVHEGSDGRPLYASVVNSSEGAEQLPGTLLLHVGEAAAKRVSNQDPLKAKDGAEDYKIWNDFPGSTTVHVLYRNYSKNEEDTRTYSGVERVVFEGGLGDDWLDASGLQGLPVFFDGGDGNDRLTLGSGHGETVSRLVGGDGNDSITVIGGGIVEIVGGVGDDTLVGGTGIVRIEGGEGADKITTRAGSTSTIVMAEDYGIDTATLAADALQNLLDFTRLASAIDFLLDGGRGPTIDGMATAGEKNVLTFNAGGVTEIRGSTQADSFSVRNPRTRSAPRYAAGLSGLLLRGGQGDDLYDFVLDSVSNMDSDGISIDDVQAITKAVAGAVTCCGACNKIESIAVAEAGAGYALPPQVMIIDPTGSGAQATATIDELGRVTSIQVIEGGSNYTNPQVLLIAPRSLGDRLVISTVRPAGSLSVQTPATDGRSQRYEYQVDNKGVRFVGWGDNARPTSLDQSEIDSVTINMPEGVFSLGSAVNLFQTFTVNASRMTQYGKIVADSVDITTDHGFQVRHPIHAINNGDVRIRVTGDGTNTGQGDLNAEANLAKATAVVSGGSVTGLTITSAGTNYYFNPSITVGSDGATPGTGARFVPTIASGSISGFHRVNGGSGYYTNPAPVVVIPPPASIQVDAMITSSRPNNYTGFGRGDGRGRVLLFADTGAVTTAGEVFFPEDIRPGMPQGSRTIDWINGDFRYRSSVGLDALVNPAEHPGISVGLGAEYTARLDADGRVIGFTQVKGGSGYSADLPPLVEIEGLATAVPIVSGGKIVDLVVTYPGDGYGQPPRVTIKPNGFGRIVDSPDGATTREIIQDTLTNLAADGSPINRVHIRAMGGKLVAKAGTGVGDPLKPLKSDVETFVAEVSAVGGGVHLLEKDGLRIGKDQSVSGITTVNGDVSITTFGGALELGAPRQALDEEGRPLWQDAAKTIPIYDRDPETGRIIYEGGDIATGSGDVKLTADDVEVNVDLNGSGGSGTITLQPVRMDAEIGLAGTRARVTAKITEDGKLIVRDGNKLDAVADSFWGGRGYTTPPLVIVDPAGQRAYAAAVVEAGAVSAIDVIYGGTNYDPANPPAVTIFGGGIAGGGAATPAIARAIVGADGVITGFTIIEKGSGYFTAPNVSIASPGQALVQAVLDTANPDPVTGRFAVKEFIVTNPGRNYRSAPFIEVAAPYDFTLDADEVNQFAGKFAQVVIGRIEGQHLFHSPEGKFQGNVVLRAPRAGGTLDVASFTTTGPVSIVGSGNTFHFDAAGASVGGTSISIDDNVIVHKGVSGVATSSTGEIVVFGAGKGMIDGDPNGDDDGDNEDLRLAAKTNVTVTGAIGSRWKLDDLTITTATRGLVTLEQGVRLTGSLRITGANANGDTNPGLDADDVVGAVMIGGIVDVDGDLVIDASSAVTFQADVTVGGKLEIRGAASVTFKRGLSVGGTMTLEDVPGAIRFGDVVHVVGEAEIKAGTLIEIGGGIRADGNLTLTSDAIDLKGGVATVVGSGDGTLVLRPATASRPIRVGTPQGLPNDTLDISDTDLAAIDDGWKRVVIGDEAVGTGAVTIGSIGTQQGGRNSSLASTTTIVGGSVTVAQKVDVAATAGYLQLVARTGDVTVNAAINETAAERNDWLRLEAVQGDVTIKAPIRATQTVSLISGKTTSQTSTASIITSGLRVSSGGAVTLESQGNAFDTLAVITTNDAISIRENSGYTIGTVDGVSGITVGTATATLRSTGTVGQTAAGVVSAAELSLQGAGGTWTLTQGNSIGTLSANTGSLSVADVADLTVGSVTASKASGTAVELRAPSGIKLANAIGTLGGDVVIHDKATLAADITINVVDGPATGEVEFRSTVDGTAAGQQSLTVTGKLDAQDSIGATTALKSLSVSDAATLAGGKTFRTAGDQTYAGAASSAGTITVQAGSGAAVKFLGNVSLGGLATVNANYDVELTGTSVTVTNAVTFNNTGSVKLGNDATDDLLFAGGLTSSAPSMTSLAGTVRTTNANATFGNASPARGVMLTRDATVSTGSGNATFAGTVNGARRLVVNAAGDTTFSSVVGGDTPLAHLETDAAGRTLLNGGAITTASPTSQVYNDDVVLGVNTTITANNRGAVTFAKTINGSRTLTVNTDGTTTFGGAVGNTTPLTSVTTDRRGTTRLGGSVTTSGGSGQEFNDAVILTADATLAAGSGAITFASSLDGAFNLAVNTTGTSTFGGKVGDGTPLASLTTDSVIPTGGTSIVTGGLVRTSGQQAWRDNVVSLATDATFRSENGAITAGASTTFSSSGKSASFSAATGIGTAANPIRLAQTEVTATITGTGDIYLVGVGDLVIASAGLLTPAGRISLDASGDIRVPSGGRIAAGSVPGQGVSATKPIRWSVVGTADSGAGSLRQVIANANTTGVAGVVVFSGSTNMFNVGSRLPDIASPLTIDGTNRGVVINANRQVDAGLILQAAATGSVVRGLTLQNFTGFGITLDGVRNATIERNTVTSVNTVESMGLLARGDLAGTRVLGNTFSGGLRGALLDGARNLIFGEIGNGNVLSNNRAAPSNPSFAGTGIRAQGVLTGTVVAGNTFTNNNYGFAFISALNLRLERNLFTRNSVAGIYIEGDSRGSSQTGNTFGRTQSDRNKVNLLRSQGTKFGGAEVKAVGQPQVSVTKNRK